jgi:hypothetical protein
MKIEIQLEDLWLDEVSGSLNKILKQEIIGEVVNKIRQEIRLKVDEEIKQQVGALVESQLQTLVAAFITSAMQVQKFKPRYSSEEITLAEWVGMQFKNNDYTSKTEKAIKEVAAKFADEMKNRFDLLFASQFVAKMNNQGMLREDVAKLLLPESN